MFRRLRAPSFGTLLVTGLGFMLLFGCGGSKGKGGGGAIVAPSLDTIPANWAGIWSVQVLAKVCGTAELLLNTTVVDTLCAGDSTSGISFGDTLCADATFRVSGNTTTYSCTDNVSSEGCSGVMTVNISTTIDPVAGTSTGSGRIALNVEPETETCSDFCIDITMTGTRTGPPPSQCGTTSGILAKALRGRSIASLVRR